MIDRAEQEAAKRGIRVIWWFGPGKDTLTLDGCSRLKACVIESRGKTQETTMSVVDVVWIVEGHSGTYVDDAEDWVVCAYPSQKLAEDHIAALEIARSSCSTKHLDSYVDDDPENLHYTCKPITFRTEVPKGNY